MLTYTGLRNLYGKLVHDKSSENLTAFDILNNELLRSIIESGDYSWREKEFELTTVADQQAYNLPNDLGKFYTLYHTISTQNYVPLGDITSLRQWNQLNTSSASSDTPEYQFTKNKTIEFYPIPASSGNTITGSYLRRHIELNTADYATGTITSIANGATTVTGDSTAWTAAMAGRYIQLPDRQWYEISSRTSGTVLELVNDYQGITVAADTATYTIGQCSIVPEESQMLSIYGCCEIYFTSINSDINKATLYGRKVKEGYTKLNKERSSGVKLSKGSISITNPQKYYNV